MSDTILQARSANTSGIPRPVRLTSQVEEESAWLGFHLHKGKTLRHAESRIVSPSLALLLLDFNTDNYRVLAPPRISEYAQIMSAGRWGQSTQGITLDKRPVLLDGQHRLSAVVQSGVSVPMTIWFGAESTEADVLDIGRTRTAADHLRRYQLEDSPERAALAGMLLFLESKGTTAHRSFVLERGIQMAEAEDSTVRLALRIGKRLQHARVVNKTAAALAIYKILKAGANEQDVEAFFAGISTGEALVNPRLALRNTLTTGDLSRGNGQGYTVKRAAAIIITWNIWRRRPELKRGMPSLLWKHSTSLPEVERV